MTTPGTAVATADKRRALAPEHQAVLDENKARNQLVQQIRGTLWGKDVTPETARAVAQYCRENNLDPVRHVEMLGGRIYLTAELYDEKGAPLIRDGIILPEEPDYINADERLEKMAKDGDAWAAEEKTRRVRARIQFAVPESAKAAVVQRFRIAANGKAIVGVNWCGAQGGKRDPVGDAEPTKTAQTRARRRAWKQIADVIPGYAEIIRPLERRLEGLARVVTVDAPEPQIHRPVIANGGYEALPAGDRDEKGRPVVQETAAIIETNTALEPSGQPATAEEIFGDTPSPAEAAENEDVDIVTGRPLSESGRWEMPLGERKGTPIGRIDSDRLVAALDVARNSKRFGGFVSAAETVLEDRRLASE